VRIQSSNKNRDNLRANWLQLDRICNPCLVLKKQKVLVKIPLLASLPHDCIVWFFTAKTGTPACKVRDTIAPPALAAALFLLLLLGIGYWLLGIGYWLFIEALPQTPHHFFVLIQRNGCKKN
jgi:hypothetical protein